MELKRYLELIRERWWAIMLATLVTTTGTLIFVLPQPPVYESVATFVVRPRAVNAGEALPALDTLIRGGEINATYASIARSDAIKGRAQEALGSDIRVSDMSVRAEVLTGTNLLEIGVSGLDPAAVHDAVEAISAETLQYILDLNDAYELQMLDPPSRSSRPIGPNKPLTIVLGVVLGLVLGFCLALLGRYLRSSTEAQTRPEEQDPWAGPHDRRFLELRLRQEMRRADRTGGRLSFATIVLIPPGGDPRIPSRHDPQLVGRLLQFVVREEDIVASLGGASLAILMPDEVAARAREMLRSWVPTISSFFRQAADIVSTPTLSVCEYGPRGFEGDPYARDVAHSLAWGSDRSGHGVPDLMALDAR